MDNKTVKNVKETARLHAQSNKLWKRWVHHIKKQTSV